MKTVRETSKALGLTESTIRSWILERRINFVKLGGAIRISEKEIDRILRQGTVPRKRTTAMARRKKAA